MRLSTTVLASVLLASANGLVIPSNLGSEAETASKALYIPASEELAVPHKYIVILKPGLSEERIKAHMKSVTQKQNHVKGAYLKAFTKNSGIVQDFDIDGHVQGYSGYFAPEALEELKKLDEVELIEQDSIVEAKGVTTQEGAPWGLARISTKESLNGATTGDYIYDSEGGAGVTAYVIDTGINIDHKDFEGRATWGKTFPHDSDDDYVGHGTHCAGLIGGKTYGVAKKADLVAVKVLGYRGEGTNSDVIKGMQWAAKDAESKKGKPGFKGATANVSIGGSRSKAVNKVANAVAKSLILTVAAGNSFQDACNFSPSSAEDVITVGATDNTDTRAVFSNFGECVDIFAPGVDILSTSIGSDSATHTESGSSQAAPLVNGLAAYFLSLQPDSGSGFSGSTITTAQMKKALVAFGTHGVITDEGFGSPNVLAFNGAGGDLSGFYNAL